MTQAKFTPGPWEVFKHEEGFGVGRKAQEGNYWIADCIPQPRDERAEMANAHVIAAAPDLLEALRGLLPQTFTRTTTQAQLTAHWERERDLGNGMAPFVLAAYAAIAKAEGQS